MTSVQRETVAQREKCWQRLARWASQHPYVAILGMAILASVLSAHPVVFFGKSFVSPSHGTHLLYDNYPTLPGYTSRSIENVKGADVGAVMWAHLPYSVVESRAIFRDGELPLWNRYNSTGVTLFGQGQSMLGDPLNLLVVATGGASWAWDAKYVTAKCLFALAFGLILYALTRDLVVALLVSFSSVFIPFFAFRFNHPAIFSMCYAPWILYFSIRVAQLRTDQLPTAVFWLSGLILANWMVMNSGTAKEAYMLLVCLNLTGALILALSKEDKRLKVQKAARWLMAQMLFTAISAPVWFVFLDNIRKSYSSYDIPHALQIPIEHFIGIFDDIFYRQLMQAEQVVLPAANFFVLFGCLWALVRYRLLFENRASLAIALGTAIPLALAFTIVPPSLITAIPFLGNVVHVGNTFSVVAIVHLIVLGGLGLHICRRGFREERWPIHAAVTFVALGSLIVMYFGYVPHKSLFFTQYVASLLLAFVAFPFLARRVAHKAEGGDIVLLAVCLVLFHWRHGMYLGSWADDYVMNPKERVDLQIESASIRHIKDDMREPYRVVGLGSNLFSGYNASIAIEGINGADALINRFYREFTKSVPFRWVWDWRIVVTAEKLPELTPVLNFMNVKYYVSLPRAEPVNLPSFKVAGRFDLAVYRAEAAWPRAYFTNHVERYASISEFVSMLRQNAGPFAAVDQATMRHLNLQGLVASRERTVVPATEYTLTNNTTTFTIRAPEKGIVVLAEAYSDGDFEATLDGRPAEYVRVNHLFKGLFIDRPGLYTVSFSYWPRHLSSMLRISGFGILILVIWIVWPSTHYATFGIRLEKP